MLKQLLCRTRSSQVRPYHRAMSVTLLAYLGLSATSRVYPAAAQPWAGGAEGLLFFALVALTAVIVTRSVDEFQRTLLTRAFFCATLLTMGFAIVWGSVEAVSESSLPHIPLLALPVLHIVLTALFKVAIFRRNAPSPEPAH